MKEKIVQEYAEMCFNKVEGPKTLRRHTLVKKSITQITEDFIKKIGEIFKESEKLYETEEKIKSQTQNLPTSLAELFIEQIDNEILRDKKKRKYAIQPCCRRKGYVL